MSGATPPGSPASTPADAETSAAGPPSGGFTDELAAPTAASLGRYVVLEEVGKGGMGRVLRAYDPKLQREVALKELRAERLGEDGSRRLVGEARAMAKLSHANVVAVYDVEELGSDRVVLVMEYVAGMTLRAWLGQKRHDWRKVVGHFIDAGRGLAAAHAAGLLHRDFKPANVLIAGTTVKVTDFGLAKLESSSAPDSDDSLESFPTSDDMTKTGTVLGTPRYMAPEQHRGQPLTAAADQYAFCVALWEALCGQAPFSGAAAGGLQAFVDRKLEGPPAWPDARAPGFVAEAVRRGLAGQPQDRWPSMDALLAALAYDTAKRRNRWIAAGVVIGGLGLAGTSLSSWTAARAERCSGAAMQLAGVWDDASRADVHAAMIAIHASYADAIAKRTSAELDRYASEWEAMHTETCEATTIRGEQSVEVMDLRMACLYRARMELEAVAQVLADAEPGVVQRAGNVVGGLAPLARCADVEALQADVEPPPADEAEAVKGIRGLLAEVKAERKAGRYAVVRAKLAEAKQRLGTIEYGPVRTEVALEDGYILDVVGQYEASEAALLEALDLGSRFHQWDAMQSAASTLIFTVGNRQGHAEEGLRYRELARGLAAGDPLREAAVHNHVAAVLTRQRKYPEAEAELRQGLALREKLLGSSHREVAAMRSNVAAVLSHQGRDTEAEAELRQTLAAYESTLGTDHPLVAVARLNLSDALMKQGRYPEAKTEAQSALAIREKTLGADHPDIATTLNGIASVLYLEGDIAGAEQAFRRVLVLRERALGADHHLVASSRTNVAVTLLDQGRVDEAEEQLRHELAHRERTLGPESLQLASSRTGLADVLFKRGDVERATQLAEQAWLRHQRDGGPLEQRGETAFLLARALWSRGPGRDRRARARDLAERAVKLFVDAGDTHAHKATSVRAWLDAR